MGEKDFFPKQLMETFCAGYHFCLMAQKDAASFQKSVQVPDPFLLYLLTGPWKTASPEGGGPAPKVGVTCTANTLVAQANINVSPSLLQPSEPDVYIIIYYCTLARFISYFWVSRYDRNI